jgi:hypothetical protein
MKQGNAVVYEVNLAVDAGAAEAYAEWLGPHIAEVLVCDGFLSAEWFDVEPAGGDDRVHWCVQYRVTDRAALDAYLAGPAGALRADGQARFSGRFTATRRVLVAAVRP